MYGASPLYRDAPDVAAATLMLDARELDGLESEPLLALELALLKGDVVGFGDYPDFSNGINPVKIDPPRWQYFEFGKDDRSGACSVRDKRAVRNDHLGLLLNPRFDRGSVVSAFPSVPALSVTASREHTAKKALGALAVAHVENGAPVPIRAHWGPASGLGARAQERVWKAVAADHPVLSSRSKPKRRTEH